MSAADHDGWQPVVAAKPFDGPTPQPVRCSYCERECFDHRSRDGKRACVLCLSTWLDQDRETLRGITAACIERGFNPDDPADLDEASFISSLPSTQHDASNSAPPAATAEAIGSPEVMPAPESSAARRVVYLAHPLGSGADRELNRRNASAWLAWATLTQRVAVVADWITLSGQLSEQHRELGLACDLALIERCDEVWLVGGRISPGMAIEREHALRCGMRVRDLTRLGYAAPTSDDVEVGVELLDEVAGG